MKIKSKITGQPVAEAEDCALDGAWAEESAWSEYAKRINPNQKVFSYFVWDIVTLAKEVAMIEAMMQQCTTEYSRKMYEDYFKSIVG